MDRLSINSIFSNRMNLYVIILLSTVSWQQCHCTIVNFNDYIDIFPSRYFVKIYVDKILSENLVSPRVPLTLLKFNTTKWNKHPKHWCRFIPVQGSFIGSRTENTLNLVSVDMKNCYALNKIKVHEVDRCKVLEVVRGRIYDGTEKVSECLINCDQMITLVIVQSWNTLDGIVRNSNNFWTQFQSSDLPNHMLVFKPSGVDSITLCHFVYSNNLWDMTLLCFEKMEMSKSLFYRMETSSYRIWKNSANVAYSSNKNAMDPSITFSMYSEARAEEILTIECLKRANESGTDRPTFFGVTMEEVNEWQSLGHAERYLLVDTTRTHFLSCHSEPNVQFIMYLKPFHAYVWSTLFLCCSFIALLISVYNRKFKLSKSFNPFLFFISTLVEEPYSVPSIVWNNNVFRTITCTWMLTAMVFTNLYAGIMISDVTAPLPGEILKNFDQVMNTDKEYMKLKDLDYYDLADFLLSNYTDANNSCTLRRYTTDCGIKSCFDRIRYDRHYARFRDQNSFSLLQSPIEFCNGKRILNAEQIKHISHPWMYSGVSFVEKELQVRSHDDDEAYSKRLKAFFSPKNRLYPEDPKFSVHHNRANLHFLSSAIEKELVACRKSIFMAERNDLTDEKLYLKINYPMTSFYVSDDTFEGRGSKPVIWTFFRGGKSKVRYYLQQLIESGVRGGIVGLRKNQFYLKRRIGTSYIRNSMPKEANWGISGSIQTVFMIMFGSLSVALAVFTVEFIYGEKSRRFLYQTFHLLIRNLNYVCLQLIDRQMRNVRALKLKILELKLYFFLA
jgi:hypothetical protein